MTERTRSKAGLRTPRKRTYREGFREGEKSAAQIIVAFLRTLAKPGTQPADYYERAVERIQETYDVG